MLANITLFKHGKSGEHAPPQTNTADEHAVSFARTPAQSFTKTALAAGARQAVMVLRYMAAATAPMLCAITAGARGYFLILVSTRSCTPQ